MAKVDQAGWSNSLASKTFGDTQTKVAYGFKHPNDKSRNGHLLEIQSRMRTAFIRHQSALDCQGFLESESQRVPQPSKFQSQLKLIIQPASQRLNEQQQILQSLLQQ